MSLAAPSARHARRDRWLWALAALLLAPFFFLEVPASIRHWPLAELFALAHVLSFAALAWAMPILLPRNWHWPLRQPLALLAVLAVVGALLELMQPLTGRSANVEDLAKDLAGATAGIALRMRGRRLMAWGGAALLVVTLTTRDAWTGLLDHALARGQFPTLADFELPFEARRWTRGSRSSAQAASGRHALAFEVAGKGFRGTAMRYGIGDWRGYDRLLLSLHNGAIEPLQVTVSIRDAAHEQTGSRYGDRYDGHFELASGWNHLEIPLEDVRTAPADRDLDLGRLLRFVVFTRNPGEPVVLHLDAVRLR